MYLHASIDGLASCFNGFQTRDERVVALARLCAFEKFSQQELVSIHGIDNKNSISKERIVTRKIFKALDKIEVIETDNYY